MRIIDKLKKIEKERNPERSTWIGFIFIISTGSLQIMNDNINNPKTSSYFF